MKQTIMLTILLISTLSIADERYHPADTNQNNVIEQFEFDAYNQAWRNDTIWGETGKSVATNYLTRAGHLLLNGGAYQDSGGDMPMCWVSGQTVPDPYITNTIGMTFVYIEPGTFTMGSPSSELGHFSGETQHQVTLTKGYYMQTTEVTQGQWSAIMGNNPAHFNSCGDNCPMEYVSWDDVQAFITVLNEKEKSNQYRLPTEAEWEYAARAGSISALANGLITKTECELDANLNAMGWYCGNSDNSTHPVAQKQANAWGLYDMHGNVLEWCNDWYEDYPSNSVTDPEGPSSGTNRMLRGGSFNYYAKDCRSAARSASTPGTRSCHIGLRLINMLILGLQILTGISTVFYPQVNGLSLSDVLANWQRLLECKL
jgi:formylglycine-generating enzyme required for sulfatase activity